MVTSKKKQAKRNVSVGTPVTPVDMDVLLGRGNRVANWPGNVNFRHVINEHRQRYKDAHRSAKGAIANEVMGVIKRRGSRYLKREKENGPWVMVSEAKTLEKISQALREKPFTPLKSLSSYERKRSSSDKQSRTSKRSRKRISHSRRANESRAMKHRKRSRSFHHQNDNKPRSRRHQEFAGDSDEESFSDSEATSQYGSGGALNNRYYDDHNSIGSNSSSSMSSSSSSSSEGSEDEMEKHGNHQEGGKPSKSPSAVAAEASFRAAALASTKMALSSTIKANAKAPPSGQRIMKTELHVPSAIMARIKRLAVDDDFTVSIMKRLQQYIENAGHAAVPPLYESDPELADWCTAMRQSYREHKTGFRKPSAKEERIFEKLHALNFCWDFDEWHWERSFHLWEKIGNKDEKQQQQQQQQASKDDDKKSHDTKQGDLRPCENAIKWLDDQRQQYNNESYCLVSVRRVQKLKEIGIAL